MRTIAFAALVLLLGILLMPPTTQAEEPDPRTLELKIYPVGTLTLGRRHYIRAHPPVVGPDEVSDERHPLFGGQAEEPQHPLGSVDELIELVRWSVDPKFWEDTEGADMRPLGEDRIVIRASDAVHGKILAFLSGLQQGVGQTVTVDLRAVRADAADAKAWAEGGDVLLLEDATAVRLLDASRQGPGVSLCCFSGQRADVFAGKQVAWLQDADVEVAQEANTTDPIVNVSNLGLMAHVLPVLQGENVLLGVDAALASIEDLRTIPTEVNDRLEAPRHKVVRLRPVLSVPSGRWAVAEGRYVDGAWWLFLVRATKHAYASTPGRSAVVDLGTPTLFEEGAMEAMAINAADLAMPVRHLAGEDAVLWPSNFVMMEPPEMPEPRAAFGLEELADLLRESAESDVWEDPAWIEVRGGLVLLRNHPAILGRVGRQVAAVRKGSLWNLVTTAEIVEVPEDLASSMELGGVLTPASQRMLAEAKQAGRVRMLDAMRLTNMRGVRNFVRAGTEIPYLQDFEVEIAQGSTIGNPVVQDVFSGAQLDIEAARSVDGGSVHMNVEFLLTHVGSPMRTLATQHGAIELPEMDRFQVRTGVQVPLDRTALVATWSEKGMRRLLLLTPRVR